MDTKLAKGLISEIAALNLTQKITFHVMGEPTLHPDFFEILAHASAENVPVGLTTNAGGLGGTVGKRLLDFKLQQIDFSLQTPDENSFVLRKARKLTFDQYVKGILDFFSSYKAIWDDTVIKFRFLNTRFRPKDIEKKAGPIHVMSNNKELREVFSSWTEKIYDILNMDQQAKNTALKKINKLVSYKWNVVEILPNVFFETYLLADWGHAFNDSKIHDAWAGYCFGMRDHFSILHNGDVTLCCIDFNGKTQIGNAHYASLKDILSSKELEMIMKGFKKFRLVHPYCKQCLGSKSLLSWLTKPFAAIGGLYILKPYFYKKVRLFS